MHPSGHTYFPAIYDPAISYLSPLDPSNTLLDTYKDNMKAADTLVALKSPQSPDLLWYSKST